MTSTTLFPSFFLCVCVAGSTPGQRGRWPRVWCLDAVYYLLCYCFVLLLKLFRTRVIFEFRFLCSFFPAVALYISLLFSFGFLFVLYGCERDPCCLVPLIACFLYWIPIISFVSSHLFYFIYSRLLFVVLCFEHVWAGRLIRLCPRSSAFLFSCSFLVFCLVLDVVFPKWNVNIFQKQ